eukprot:1180157-Prorocentrum_minimum.AAC.3
MSSVTGLGLDGPVVVQPPPAGLNNTQGQWRRGEWGHGVYPVYTNKLKGSNTAEQSVETVVIATDRARSRLNTEHHQFEKLPPVSMHRDGVSHQWSHQNSSRYAADTGCGTVRGEPARTRARIIVVKNVGVSFGTAVTESPFYC